MHTVLSSRATGRYAWRPQLLVLLVLLAAAGWAVSGRGMAVADITKPSVLILYDSWQLLPHPGQGDIESADGSLGSALQLEQLLGHFPFAAKLVRLSDYRPGLLARYRYTFFVGNVEQAVLPTAFLREVPHYRGSFYWMDYGFEQLSRAYRQRLGIVFQRVEDEPGYTRVTYHGVELNKGDPATIVVKVRAPARVLAVATGKKGARAVSGAFRAFLVCRRPALLVRGGARPLLRLHGYAVRLFRGPRQHAEVRFPARGRYQCD